MEPTAPRRRTAVWMGLLVLAGVVLFVVGFGDVRHFVELAEHARPGWLLAGLALQAATYATEAGAWNGVLRRAGYRVPLRTLYALAVVALFTNQTLPTAGVAGTLTLLRGLAARGIPRAVAVAAVVVDLVGYYVGFALAAIAGLLVLHAHRPLPQVVLWLASGIVAVGFVVAGGAVWLAGRSLPPALARVRPIAAAVGSLTGADPALVRAPGLLARAALLRTSNFALDGLTLWVCLAAIGHAPTPEKAVSAYVIGALARTLGVVPGGLGTFEAGAVGGLALFDVALEPALTGTLLFRGLSFWMPMLPGTWLASRQAANR